MAEDRFACLVRIRVNGAIRSHIILREQFVIGRSTTADLPLLDVAVSRQHAKVELRRTGIVITDTSTNNGITVDGKKIKPGVEAPIKSNSSVRLGSSLSEYFFTEIIAPIELLSSEEQKKMLMASMAEAENEIKETRRRIILEEQQKSLALIKREEEAQKELAEKLQRETELKIQKDIAEANLKADQIIAAARLKAETAGAETLVEYQVKREKLKAEADSILADANAAARMIQDDAFALIEKHRQESLDEGLKELAAAKQKAEETIDSANAKADETLAASRQTAEHIIASAKQSAEVTLASAKQKSDTMIAEAKKKAELVRVDADEKHAKKLEVAEIERQRIVAQATKEAEKMHQEAEYKSKGLVDEAKKRAEHLALDSKKRTSIEIDEAKRAALDATRLATFAEQEKILKEYRARVEKVQKETLEAEASLLDQQTQLDGMVQDRVRLKTEIQSLEKYETERRLIISQLEDELSRAQKIVQSVNDAENRRNEAKNEMNAAKLQAENFRAEYERKVKSVADDLQRKKEQAVVEFEAFRQKQVDDLAKEKLAGLEKLKATIEEEENRYLRTLQLRANEIANDLAKNLLPKLEADLKEKGTEVSLGAYLGTIRSSVEEVILKEPSTSTSKVETKHLGVDPEKQIAKKKTIRRTVWAASVVAISAIALYAGPLFDFLKKVQSDHSEQREITLKRNVESIYTPLQNDDWHETYTGNVLYLRYYYEAKVDPVYQEQWLLRLNNLELLRSMKLSEDDIVQFLGKERALIKQLGELREGLDKKFLDQGLEKMNQAESVVTNEIRQVLKTDENVNAVRKIERDFVTQYIKVRFGSEKSIRAPAQAKPAGP